MREISIATCKDTFDPFNSPENMKAYIDEAFHPAQLEREFSEPGSGYYFAVVDNTIAGFMRTRRTTEVEYLLGPNTLELQRLYVLPEHKGKKIGAELMDEALRIAREGKYEWLWLGVWERNFPAQKFYAKRGFERFSEHTFVMGDDPQTDWLLKIATGG